MLKFAEVQHFWNTPSSNVDSRFCAHQAPPGRAQISETRFCLPSFQNLCQLGPAAAVCKIIQIQRERSQKYTLRIWEIHFFSGFLSIRARGCSLQNDTNTVHKITEIHLFSEFLSIRARGCSLQNYTNTVRKIIEIHFENLRNTLLFRISVN